MPYSGRFEKGYIPQHHHIRGVKTNIPFVFEKGYIPQHHHIGWYISTNEVCYGAEL